MMADRRGDGAKDILITGSPVTALNSGIGEGGGRAVYFGLSIK